MTDLIKLAERCEIEAIETMHLVTKLNPSNLSNKTPRGLIGHAANCFSVADALRARAGDR